MRGGSTMVAVAILAAAAAAGCGGPAGDETDRPAGSEATAPVEEGAAVEDPVARPGDRAPGDTSPPGSPEAPAEASGATLFPEEEAEELRSYRLLLVNGTGEDAVVHASAGAGRVLLDTVPARDSLRVNVEVRSRRLRLDASHVRGGGLGEEELELRDDTISRWEVPGG